MKIRMASHATRIMEMHRPIITLPAEGTEVKIILKCQIDRERSSKWVQ
jgi:hypothetical protein